MLKLEIFVYIFILLIYVCGIYSIFCLILDVKFEMGFKICI